MICPNCKIIISEPVEYCLKCHFPINANEQTEGTTRQERLKEMLICPKCGSLHTPTAKVCRNDGTLLSKYKDIEVNLSEEKQKKRNLLNKKILLSSFVSIALFALLYIYVSDSVTKDLKKSNEKEVVVENKRSDAIFSEKEKKSPNPAFIEVEINRKLRKNGVEGIYVEVNEDFTATITGYFSTKLDRLKTFSVIDSYQEISSVVDSTKKNSQKIQGVSAFSLINKINESFKNEGLDNLIVEVDDYLNVTIKGAVRGKEEKNKAFEIAKSFKDVKNIKDLIFIVEH